MTAQVAQQFGVGLREQLGEILVRDGRVSRVELESAALEASLAGVRLGAFLLSIGLVTEEDVARALGEQFGLEYVQVDVRKLDLTLASLIPLATAQRLQVLPIETRGESVRMAVSDPTDILLADELRMMLDCTLDVVVAERSTIAEGIAHLHSSSWFESNDELRINRPSEPSRITVIDSTEDDSAVAVEIVNALLRRAIELRASDLHLVPRRDDMLARVRVDGVMRELETVGLGERTAVIARLKVMARLDIAERRLPQDGRVAIRLGDTDTDLRLAILPTTFGENVVIRIGYLQAGGDDIDLTTLGLDGGTAAALRFALASPGGAIVVAGPTGSGKTTTLYAALNELNDGSRSVVTIEDPVERAVEGLVQVEVNARSGLTFARGLRTILRADPDVILVGEIRDAETAEIAMQAAMTGHLVLTTVHAESAAAALIRLRELGVPPATIASSIRLVLSQRLMRRVCGSCGERPGRPGCSICGYTGYSGRVAAYESLTTDRDLRKVIADDSSSIGAGNAIQEMRTLRDHAAELVAARATTIAEVERVCGQPEADESTLSATPMGEPQPKNRNERRL